MSTSALRTIEWRDGSVRFIDQTRLPADLVYVDTTDWRRLCTAIARLEVRGAPALGVAGAMAVALAAAFVRSLEPLAFQRELDAAAAVIRATRPTAVNLAWGVDRAIAAVEPLRTIDDVVARLARLATDMADEDVATNHAIGQHGAPLIPDGAVLTHCNAGMLATVGYGTALGVLRSARDAGRHFRVYVDETRPLLQGARLTTWELLQDGFDVTLIADAMAGHVMQRGMVDCVIVGADRIAANGDVANKIGTYQLAVLAREHAIPFIVVAPLATLDLETESGAGIPIEERDPAEVRGFGGTVIAPTGVAVYNPAFDVTPARLVSAIVTEAGVARAPFASSLAGLAAGRQLTGATSG